MKRQLIATVLALLCSGVPGVAKDEHEDDKSIASFVMFIASKITAADCPYIAHTERGGAERFLTERPEGFLIIRFANRDGIPQQTPFSHYREVAPRQLGSRRLTPDLPLSN